MIRIASYSTSVFSLFFILTPGTILPLPGTLKIINKYFIFIFICHSYCTIFAESQDRYLLSYDNVTVS